MMAELRELDLPALEQVYEKYYIEAFPPTELKPFSSMRAAAEAGVYRSFGLYAEDGAPLAFASLWLGEGGCVLLDYLCVPPERRSCGLGGRMLKLLPEAFPKDSVFVIESEDPDFAADRALAQRRLGFYRRCGAEDRSFRAALFGVCYRIFTLSVAPVEEETLLRQYEALYRGAFPPAVYRKAVRIPLTPGERVPVFEKWF